MPFKGKKKDQSSDFLVLGRNTAVIMAKRGANRRRNLLSLTLNTLSAPLKQERGDWQVNL